MSVVSVRGCLTHASDIPSSASPHPPSLSLPIPPSSSLSPSLPLPSFPLPPPPSPSASLPPPPSPLHSRLIKLLTERKKLQEKLQSYRDKVAELKKQIAELKKTSGSVVVERDVEQLISDKKDLQNKVCCVLCVSEGFCVVYGVCIHIWVLCGECILKRVELQQE